MIEIFLLMVLVGGFSFIGFGISAANSIEAKQSEKVGNVMVVLSFAGVLLFIAGLIGLFVVS